MLASRVILCNHDPMHVREIPGVIFNDLVSEPQIINVREFVSTVWPNQGHSEEYPDSTVTVGAVGETVLRLTNSPDSTSLQVFSSLSEAVVNSASDALVSIVAGNRYTGVWTYGGGEQLEQNIWLKVNNSLVRAEDLAKIPQTFELIGKIALRCHQLLESGVFEVSQFFTKEIETS